MCSCLPKVQAVSAATGSLHVLPAKLCSMSAAAAASTALLICTALPVLQCGAAPINSPNLHGPPPLPATRQVTEALRAHHQKSLYLPTARRFIFLDGPASPETVATAGDHVATLVGVAITAAEVSCTLPTLLATSESQLTLTSVLQQLAMALGNPIVKLSTVVAPTSGGQQVTQLPCPEFNYSTEENSHTSTGCPICPHTLRPFYIVGNATWRQAAVACFGPLNQQLSLDFLYISFIRDIGCFPEDEFEAFAVYCARNELTQRSRTTLPALFRTDYDNMCKRFAAAYAVRWPDAPGQRPSAAQASFVIEASKRIKARRAMEAGLMVDPVLSLNLGLDGVSASK